MKSHERGGFIPCRTVRRAGAIARLPVGDEEGDRTERSANRGRKSDTRAAVAVFLSTFANKVDRKGRISVPATFRAALEQEKSAGVILYPSFKHPCLEGCGDERIAPKLGKAPGREKRC